MALDLPKPVLAYFAADKGGTEGLARCFTENAVVLDEGQSYTGLSAIKQWKAAAKKKYQYSIEPLACAQKGGKTVVTGRLTGNFPGSPVDVQFIFGLDGDKIASLEIRA